MFDLPVVETSGTGRAGTGHGIGEIVATTGLVTLIFMLARTGRHALSAAAPSGVTRAYPRDLPSRRTLAAFRARVAMSSNSLAA